MNYWLLKSEPNVWSIEQQLKVGAKGADWDGVRNYQAANNLKKMKKGDLCFFYHSNIGKEIVGIVEVIKTAYNLNKLDYRKYFSINKKFFRKKESKFLIGSNKNSLHLKNKHNFKFNIFGKKLIKKMYKSL